MRQSARHTRHTVQRDRARSRSCCTAGPPVHPKACMQQACYQPAPPTCSLSQRACTALSCAASSSRCSTRRPDSLVWQCSCAPWRSQLDLTAARLSARRASSASCSWIYKKGRQAGTSHVAHTHPSLASLAVAVWLPSIANVCCQYASAVGVAKVSSTGEASHATGSSAARAAWGPTLPQAPLHATQHWPTNIYANDEHTCHMLTC